MRNYDEVRIICTTIVCVSVCRVIRSLISTLKKPKEEPIIYCYFKEAPSNNDSNEKEDEKES